MSKSNGIIAILAYPNTFVRPAKWEFVARLLPYLGIGNKNAIQAGHAALLLIKKGKTEINYFDFGRFITTYKKGRVRSKETDVELCLPVNAKFVKDTLSNLEEILLWLEKHPDKTHGSGKLIVSINERINYDKALNFINGLINSKEIPYGAFLRKGSNCARFVSTILRVSTNKKKIKNKLSLASLLTPSPIGNVLHGKSNPKVHQVYQGKITPYNNKFVIREHFTCFFKKREQELSLKGKEEPNIEIFSLENGTWLGGIGSGAWFTLDKKITLETYKISRYNSIGQKDFEGVFRISDTCFDSGENYHFVYPTNCHEAFLIQNNKTYSFKKHLI